MIGLTVNGVEKAVANLAGARREMPDANARGVAKSTLLGKRELQKQMTGPKTHDPFWGVRSASKEHLAVRSGLTRASLNPGTRVYVLGSQATGVVGSSQQHLLRQEDGGTFAGTSPQGYNRIPTRAAQTAAGVDRWAGISIRDIPGAFLLTSKAGKLWAAVRTARGFDLLYLLVKSVTLPARRIFGRVTERIRLEVVKNSDGEVAAVVRRANS